MFDLAEWIAGVTDRNVVRPESLCYGLFLPFPNLFAQVIQVVRRENRFDVEDQLLVGRTLAADDLVLFDEVHPDVEFIHDHPVFEIAQKPIRLFDENIAHGRMSFQESHHRRELLTPRMACGFHFQEPMSRGNGKAVLVCIRFEQSHLSVETVSFSLFFGRNPRIKYCVRYLNDSA